MKLTCLVDNQSRDCRLVTEHGLSLLLELGESKILFDVGQGRLFLENAEKLGLSIADVDLLVISHGHSDHGGGMRTFLDHNVKAKVLLQREAFKPSYARDGNGKLEAIGLDPAYENHPRIFLVDDDQQLADDLWVFSDLPMNLPLLASNDGLLVEDEGRLRADDFRHELYLVAEEGDKQVLFTGCGHKGLANILASFRERCGRDPDLVIGGFHLYSLPQDDSYDSSLKAFAQKILCYDSKFLTGHCTGRKAYKSLKESMGDRIDYLAAGDSYEF